MKAKRDFFYLSKWEKFKIPEQFRGEHWDTQMSEAWRFKGKMNFVVQKREFSCDWGKMNHITIKKYQRKILRMERFLIQ